MSYNSSMETSSSILSKCYNLGKITGESDVGGIAGNVDGKNQQLLSCYNKGIVSGTSNIGSVIGSCELTDNTLNHLYYLSTLNYKAINNVNYDEKNITSTTKNINSFGEFKTWIAKFN